MQEHRPCGKTPINGHKVLVGGNALSLATFSSWIMPIWYTWHVYQIGMIQLTWKVSSSQSCVEISTGSSNSWEPKDPSLTQWQGKSESLTSHCHLLGKHCNPHCIFIQYTCGAFLRRYNICTNLMMTSDSVWWILHDTSKNTNHWKYWAFWSVMRRVNDQASDAHFDAQLTELKDRREVAFLFCKRCWRDLWTYGLFLIYTRVV